MRIFVRSFGCSTNLADGEVLAGCLAEAGHKLTDSAMKADVIVYNTCAVKGPTENRMIEILRRTPNSKKLIVTGCLPLINFRRLCREVAFDGVSGPATGSRIVDLVARVSNNGKVVALEDAQKSMPELNLPRIPLNPVISIVPISYGCLGSCTYCCVRSARGHLRSYSIQGITERVKRDIAQGAREIWITSQDTACYGRDIDTSLPELLRSLSGIEGDFWVRVGMMTPNALMDNLRELMKPFQDRRIFKFIHLPVQSGDDHILERMMRSYSVSDFRKAVESLRDLFPSMTLSTDIICGFPGESEKAFGETLKTIEEVKPDIVNISKFFPRPGTPTLSMKKDWVSNSDIRHRSCRLAKVARKISTERNQRWVGWSGEVIIDETGKIANTWIGRNFAYKPVALASSESLLGKSLRIKVIKAFPTYLEGKIVE